jgi:hypothetical protein
MHDLVIDRGTQDKLKRFAGSGHVITLEGRPRSGVFHHALGGDFQIQGTNAFASHFAEFLQDLVNE